MKNVKQIEKDINEITSEIKRLQEIDTKEAARDRKRLRLKLPFLRFCKQYLQTDPNPDFLKKEVDRITNRINKFDELYKPLDAERFDKKTLAAHKKSYEKEMGIPKLREQMTAINFLLK